MKDLLYKAYVHGKRVGTYVLSNLPEKYAPLTFESWYKTEVVDKNNLLSDVTKQNELFYNFIDEHYSHSSENYRTEIKNSFNEYLKNKYDKT